MFTPAEGMSDANASAIAVLNYVVRTLHVICESSMFKNNLMKAYVGPEVPVMAFGVCDDSSLQRNTTNVLQCELEEGPVWQMEDNEYAPVFCSLQGSARTQPDDRINAHPAA